MTSISERANADQRLDDVTIHDESSQALVEFELVPVLATPGIAVAAGLFTAGLAVEEAADG